MDFLEYGSSNDIPELTDILNCSILAISIGRFLHEGYKENSCQVYDDICYKAYINTLTNLLHKDEEEIINLVSTTKLFGITKIPKYSFSLFFELIKKNIKAGFVEIREREREQYEETKRRKEAIEKCAKLAEDISSKIMPELDKLNIKDRLSELGLGNYDDFVIYPFEILQYYSRDMGDDPRNSLTKLLAINLIYTYTDYMYAMKFDSRFSRVCPAIPACRHHQL
jgi:hypothetical protein